jgi:hypothetical protein
MKIAAYLCIFQNKKKKTKIHSFFSSFNINKYVFLTTTTTRTTTIKKKTIY